MTEWDKLYEASRRYLNGSRDPKDIAATARFYGQMDWSYIHTGLLEEDWPDYLPREGYNYPSSRGGPLKYRFNPPPAGVRLEDDWLF